MTPDEAQRTLDRYRSSPAYPKPGESFGLSIIVLKARIYDRLIARGIGQAKAHFRTERIYERIMRDKPSYAEYCEARRILQPTSPSTSLTRDEWQHLADLFDGANDPLSASIAAKAHTMLARSE